MSAQAQQQQQSAVSSAQISSMQQHGAGVAGGAQSQGFNSLFDLFINGLGKDQSMSLQNVGLGKMFTSGEITAGLHAPGGKSMGKFMEGLESSWEMGAGGQDGQAQQAGSPQAHPDEMQQHQMAEQQRAAAQQANNFDPNQNGGQMPYGQPNGQMPHGYGPDQAGGQNAMGMGGNQAGYNNAQQQGAGGAPHGYGPDNDDKGMFNTSRLDNSDGINPFAASFDGKSGQFDDAQRMRYTDTSYHPDSSSSGSSSNSSSSDSGGDGDALNDEAPATFNEAIGRTNGAGRASEAGHDSKTPGRTPAEARERALESRGGGMGMGG